MTETTVLETKSVESADYLNTFRTKGRDPQHINPPLVNKPGELVWIATADLHIDKKYQRMLRRRRINRIANSWNWVACGALSVSLRKDGSGYFIFDGQHRHAAAKMRGDIKELPCIVFELDSAAEEAAGFVAANTERTPLKRIEQYPALLLIGDPVAKVVDQLCREAGRWVGIPAGPVMFSAVTALSRNIQDDEGAMRRVWPVIVENCEDRSITGRYLDALWATERRMPHHQSLADDRWRQRLHKIGVDQILQALRTSYLYEGRINQQIAAETVARTINRNLRPGNHLKLRAEKLVRPTPAQRTV